MRLKCGKSNYTLKFTKLKCFADVQLAMLDIADSNLLQESCLKAVKVLACVLEEPISRHGNDIDYSADRFSCFANFIQFNAGVASRIRQQLSSPYSFQFISNSPFYLSTSTVWSN